jgi:hypothetical protein
VAAEYVSQGLAAVASSTLLEYLKKGTTSPKGLPRMVEGGCRISVGFKEKPPRFGHSSTAGAEMDSDAKYE